MSRALAHSSKDSVILYAIQSLFLLLAPILFAASVYVFLGQLIGTSGNEGLSIISTKWTTKLFVGGDVTCFIIQAAGGGILSAAKSQTTIDVGNYVILAGLVLQIVVFILFILVAGIFHTRLQREPAVTGRQTGRKLILLYTTSVLITARNVYRVLEYGLGQDGYLIAHEWTLYVFDAGLMTLVMVVTLGWHAAARMPSSELVSTDPELMSGFIAKTDENEKR